MANQVEFGGPVDEDKQVLEGIRPEYDGDGGGSLSAQNDGIRTEYTSSDGVIPGTNKTF